MEASSLNNETLMSDAGDHMLVHRTDRSDSMFMELREAPRDQSKFGNFFEQARSQSVGFSDLSAIQEEGLGEQEAPGRGVKLFKRYELIKNNEQFQQYTKEGITLESEPTDSEAKQLTQPQIDQLAEQKEKMASNLFLGNENGESELVGGDAENTSSQSEENQKDKTNKQQ